MRAGRLSCNEQVLPKYMYTVPQKMPVSMQDLTGEHNILI